MTDAAPPAAKCERCGDPVRAGAKLCFTCASTMAVPFPTPQVAAPAEPVAPPRPDGACPRCGTFAPLRTVMGHTVCADCVARVLHPVAGEGLDAAALSRGAYRIAGAVAVPAAFVTLGIWLVLGLPFTATGHTFLAALGHGLVGETVARGAVVVLAWQALAAQPLSLGDAIRRGSRHFLRVLLTMIAIGFVSGVAFVFLLVPGVWLLATWCVAIPLAVLDGKSTGDALSESTAMTHAMRGPLLVAVVATGLPHAVMLVASAALTIWAKRAAPDVASALRLADLVALTLARVTMIPPSVLGVVVYAKLAARLGADEQTAAPPR